MALTWASTRRGLRSCAGTEPKQPPPIPTSIMQHLQLKKREVRFQGSWREKGESMPDTYLREGQTIVLGAQEKCLAYLRGGGDIFILEGVQVKPGETPEVDPEDKARVEKAMDCGMPDGAPAAEMPRVLLDPAFDTDLNLDEKTLSAEKEVATNFTEEAEHSEPEKIDEELASLELELPGDMGEDGAWDEMDSEEGFATFWVQSKTATGATKLHLTAPLVWIEGVLQEARPRCGLSGQYDYVKSEDAWDDSATLCRRCSPWMRAHAQGFVSTCTWAKQPPAGPPRHQRQLLLQFDLRSILLTSCLFSCWLLI